jgi:hypothetical protein
MKKKPLDDVYRSICDFMEREWMDLSRSDYGELLALIREDMENRLQCLKGEGEVNAD